MRLTRHALAVLLTFLLLSHSSPTHIPEAVSKPAPKPTMVFPVMATGAAALYEAWSLESAGLSREAFEKAYAGYTQFKERSMLKVTRLLTIVDYSLSSAKKRLFVLDMDAGKMVFNTLVAHGRNSGVEMARQFSNAGESHKTSLGFYITLNTYQGGNGYSLKLKGCEPGINDNALNRAIVMHGADYVSEDFIRRNGFLGRSHGCPAVPQKLNKKIIDQIKGGSCMFLYYPAADYIKRSKILNT
ncbi:MAG TPA: murein L,D-transpeptidase catalytic domain family protein [Ferruginibacter sp.]|jgi:hypothetical protein|nr:murein L,D-transpeptidase catalytic domain family protein [Chitinophagales bacterium]HNA01033.1 murein L,D-transpeptidase catalytic domain family protein [Ferruginibacter sp.]HNA15761.1 murein L,D-transpeptidase catalytic domain family protein [Ferruginibacter sp.]HNN72561.1 murein L,D-transpeptidase catalytic domain family protein [Ferruginibacter sp.]